MSKSKHTEAQMIAALKQVEAGLALRRNKRKHCVRQSAPLRQYTAANQEWALDFVHDAIAVGRAIRVLSVVDAYTRECLALEVDTSFASRRVTHALDEIIQQRGEPRSIRCDNGPELTSRHFLAWCIERKIELVHIQPGKPTQNAHVESFHFGSVGFTTCLTQVGRSPSGAMTTTNNDLTAA
jgi:putative transposase